MQTLSALLILHLFESTNIFLFSDKLAAREQRRDSCPLASNKASSFSAAYNLAQPQVLSTSTPPIPHSPRSSQPPPPILHFPLPLPPRSSRLPVQRAIAISSLSQQQADQQPPPLSWKVSGRTRLLPSRTEGQVRTPQLPLPPSQLTSPSHYVLKEGVTSVTASEGNNLLQESSLPLSLASEANYGGSNN
ncbi:unnamed protein product [Protopolystoma xenopodis]|uniref:Uncharacterized protein n=1 Tax=Protopolystoma xenopodis TaxID=117903 RepID=A0A3S5ANA8_9PLAT|nr:unnamed protein product [Protopolystoma xenopodis]